MIRAPVQPLLLRWARERAGMELAGLAERFPKLGRWEQGEEQPTLRQLERFAKVVHVPVGYLFLSSPPEEILPIPDYRTIGSHGIHRPSPDLLQTIHACQEKQAWFREFALSAQLPPVEFVGSATLGTATVSVARQMQKTFLLSLDERKACRGWEEAQRYLCRQAERAGVLVMVSGVVGSDTKRKLDPDEFRGFSLAEKLAPLVFVNGADTRAARIFSLAHELAHLWLGTSALSDMGAAPRHTQRTEEAWCNAVAAEFLVPNDELNLEYTEDEPLDEALKRLGSIFKVSALVVLRRMLDSGKIRRDQFDEAWKMQLGRFKPGGGGGGDFYKTTMTRVSRRFAHALVESTLEGRTLYRDAFRMLGISKTATFNSLARFVLGPVAQNHDSHTS